MFIQLILLSLLGLCRPHGYLQDPSSRSSMWRFGFDNPVNWNDNELFCGGFRRQWLVNNGKCGICGDPWDEPEPRDNENGGKYGNGIIVRTYENGQTITVAVNITANHKGHFEFRICPVRYENQKEDQDCLDQYVLELADGSGYKYVLPHGSGREVFLIDLNLPRGLTCERCVFQWHYRTANTWGICEDGTGAVGCGPQETFRGCADIRIEDSIYKSTIF